MDLCEAAKRGAEEATTMKEEVEEAQCIDALDQLNNSPITSQLLVSSQEKQMDSLSVSNRTPLLLFYNKRRKFSTCMEDKEHISDDILINILSHLTLKEAVRTSILSRRWRYLWKSFTGCLNFDNPIAILYFRFRLDYLSCDSVKEERHRFVSWVNHVLSSLRDQSSIEQLRICFDINSQAIVDNWIKFAVEKRVQKLELDFTRFGKLFYKVQYTFPSHLGYSSFRTLTSLSLKLVDITGEVLEHLLSHCPLLEVLSVKSSMCLTNLKISGPSLKLRCLKLQGSYMLKDIEIDAPNLISFEYVGPKIPVPFKNVPNLAEVSFGGSFCKYYMMNLCQLSSFLVQLHTLKLDLIHTKAPGAVPYNIPELCNLKHLEITMILHDDDYLLPCAAFLKAFPSLYKFTLKFSWVSRSTGLRQTVRNHPYLMHSKLSIRVVELVGFMGLITDSEFVIYLIENAKLLEKIIIDPCVERYKGTAMELIFRESIEYLSARKQAIELAARFPLWEFVIL